MTNNIVFPEYKPFCTKVLFYRIPKNASTSIYDNLCLSNLIKVNAKEISEKIDQRIYKNIFEPSHIKPKELFDLNIIPNIDNIFSFCVVRNPWDRLVSMYHFVSNSKWIMEAYNEKEKPTFDKFCQKIKEHRDDPFFIGSHKQTEWALGKNGPKTILKFENLSEEFEKMIEDIGLCGVGSKLPHENKTNHKHYSEYYNSENKNIIADIFEEDIDNFNYTFNKQKSDKHGFLKI